MPHIRSRTARIGIPVLALTITAGIAWRPTPTPSDLPKPLLDQTTRTTKPDTAIFAGGCFWGVEAVFEHVRGVTDVVSGYIGGETKSPDYDAVSSGSTGHAEAVRIIYDPSKVTYGELLRIFFSVAHDPTQLNRQGPDVGTQYRSAIYYGNEAQHKITKAYIDQITKAKTFSRPIVTQVESRSNFYIAEPYHQDFATRHPDHPYIKAHDQPKVERLKRLFKDHYIQK